jgi:hypothetical protein
MARWEVTLGGHHEKTVKSDGLDQQIGEKMW